MWKIIFKVKQDDGFSDDDIKTGFRFVWFFFLRLNSPITPESYRGRLVYKATSYPGWALVHMFHNICMIKVSNLPLLTIGKLEFILDWGIHAPQTLHAAGKYWQHPQGTNTSRLNNKMVSSTKRKKKLPRIEQIHINNELQYYTTT